MPKRSPPFATRFVIDVATGCHNWIGPKDALGYGRHKNRGAHRVAYEATRGAIPPGLVLDQLCRNPSCCNPAHLEAVTHRENCIRGVSPWAVNAQRVSCKRGHPFDEGNTYTAPRGTRECKACRREADRRRYAVGNTFRQRESAAKCARGQSQ